MNRKIVGNGRDRSLLIAILIGFVGSCVFPTSANCLNAEMTALLTQAWGNFDMKWVTKNMFGRVYLQEVWFGMKESFLKERVSKFPERREGDVTLRDFFLDRAKADGSNLILMVGGEAKYKPNKFFQATGNFLAKTRVNFDPGMKRMQFIIESKLEKLVSKKFGIDVSGVANKIVKMLKVRDEVKEVDIAPIIKRMQACELKFNRFIVQDGYYYISGSSVTDVLFSDKIEKSLQALKAGNVPEAARIYRESLKKP